MEGFHDPAVVSKMKYNPLGKTGCNVSVLGLGSSAFGSVFKETTDEDSVKVIVESIRLGLNVGESWECGEC